MIVTAAQGSIPRKAEHGPGGILRTGYACSARRKPSRRGFMPDVVTGDAGATTARLLKSLSLKRPVGARREHLF
jgi:hypothetical protein